MENQPYFQTAVYRLVETGMPREKAKGIALNIILMLKDSISFRKEMRGLLEIENEKAISEANAEGCRVIK